MTTNQYQVTGMTCGHCERAVTEEVTRIEGVTGVEVSHVDGVLRITSTRPVDDAAVAAAVEEAGYDVARS
jgi:copper chaperone